MLLDANGIECSTGSACTAGGAALACSAGDGRRCGRTRGSLRLSLGHTSTDADVDAVLRVLPPRWSGPGGCARQCDEWIGTMKVLAAMSGGVDSSVAAARMVDAGHEVVGVHLALSSAPGNASNRIPGAARRKTPACPPGGRHPRNPLLRLGFRRPIQGRRDR